MVRVLLVVALAFIAWSAAALSSADELSECRRLAAKYNAEVEVVQHDGTRVDLLNDEYAIEVDWAKSKWKEAIGQAVLYSIHTGRKPAVLLLVKDPTTEYMDLVRAALVCGKLGITLYVERAEQ